MTFTAFMLDLARLRDDRTRKIVRMRPHAEQARVIAAVDQLDPETGLRQYRDVIISWARKHYKTTTAACIAVWGLVFDPFHTHREVVIIASDKDQAKSACLKEAKRIVQRNPWLKARIKIGADGMSYIDEDGAEHTLRALARDAAGAHGLNCSMVIVDEAWNFPNWDVLEGLSESPSRQCPLTVWASYAGLTSQRKDGNPWYDTLTRAQAPDAPKTTFLSHISGRTAVLAAGVISEAWLDRLARQFEHVPAKFRRLGLNEWSAGDAGSFLLASEISDAIDPVHAKTTATGPSRAASAIGVDLGLVRDRAAIVASHVEPMTGRLIVDHVEIHHGSKKAPVSLMLIEQRVVALARVLKTRTVYGDRWQLATLAERWTQVHSLSVHPITCESAWLDRAATNLKSWFSNRAIAIPNDPELLQELEGLEGEELRRRDRIRFTASGTNHDDACVALVLSAMPWIGRDDKPEQSIIGRPLLPEGVCVVLLNGLPHWTSCFIMGGHRPPCDPICFTSCPMFAGVKREHEKYNAQHPDDQLHIVQYWHRFPMRPNAAMKQARWMQTETMLTNLL